MVNDIRSKFIMQGCKQFEPRLFYQISLNEPVPQNHLVRRLAAVPDFSWVRSAKATLYSDTGRPSIDPAAVDDTAVVLELLEQHERCCGAILEQILLDEAFLIVRIHNPSNLRVIMI